MTKLPQLGAEYGFFFLGIHNDIFTLYFTMINQ